MTISHIEFNERKRAANELLRMKDERIADFPDWLVAWSEKYAVAKLEANRPQTLRTPIAGVLAGAPLKGMTCREVANEAGFKIGLVSTALCGMVKSEGAYVIKLPGRSRYFPTAMALEEGRDHVLAEEAARTRLRVKRPPGRPPKVRTPIPPKPPKEPRPPKVRAEKAPKAITPKPPKPEKPKPFKVKTVIDMARNAVTGFKPKLPSVRQSVFEVHIPDHVKVQELPSGRDMRYVATGTGEAGFMDEWRRMRSTTPETETPKDEEGEIA